MPTTTVYIFPMRKREVEWEIIRLRSRGEFVGRVSAPDEKAAFKTAVKRLGVRPDEEKRLIIRRA